MKKYVSMLVVIALILLTAACGGSGNGGKQSNGDNDSKPPTNSNNQKAPPAQNEKDNVLSGKKPELRVLLPFERYDPNKEYIAEFLEKKTEYKVKYEMLPEEMPDEKLNLLMANKEPYDYIKVSKSQFFKLAESGALEPLNELIEQYAPNVRDGIFEDTWKATTIDGVIYGIPEGITGLGANSSLIVRKDWLDELELSIPTNRDELYNVLKTIKEKKNVIPLVGYGGVFAEIANTFGIANAWKEVDGKLIHQAEDPRMKEYLAFMKKLYEEDLIDSEWPINAGSKVIEKFSSGKAAMMSMAWWSAPAVMNALNNNFPDAEVATLPYLKGDNGEQIWGVNAGITYVVAIPKWSKNKEHALNLINTKLETDLFKELVIGEEGVHHRFEDGKYFPILPIFNDQLNNASYFLTAVDERVYPTYWQARVRKDPILQGYYDELQELVKGKFVIDPLSNAPPIESIAKNTPVLAKFSDDTFLQYIAGAESLDTFDSYLAKWRADGGEQMVKDANEWYAENK